MKRIVICCCGTWSPDAVDWTSRPTNVVRLAEAVRAEHGGARQLVYCDAGVGRMASPLRRFAGRLSTAGLTRDLGEAYRYVNAHYEPGDELYLLGFSRGASTVRRLAGLIRTAGVLRCPDPTLVAQALALHLDRTPESHPRQRAATLFRRSHAVEEVTPIRFLGVFDTVGGLGNPHLATRWLAPRQRFHDAVLSTTVERACQALAIDERRRSFAPSLWRRQAHAIGQLLEQVWFAGTHADMGGGHADTGLSDLPLGWMAEQAALAGLGLMPLRLLPDPTSAIRETQRGPYRLLPPYARPIGLPDPHVRGESIHPSAIERYRRQAGYRPSNLDDFFLRNPALRPFRGQGRENATYRSPEGRPSLPPPAAITTNSRPSAS